MRRWASEEEGRPHGKMKVRFPGLLHDRRAKDGGERASSPTVSDFPPALRIRAPITSFISPLPASRSSSRRVLVPCSQYRRRRPSLAPFLLVSNRSALPCLARRRQGHSPRPQEHQWKMARTPQTM